MGFELRILFLVFLFLTLILFTLRRGPVFSGQDIWIIILDFLLVPTVLGTVLTFGFLLTRTDPLPYVRDAAYWLGLQQLISFERAIPSQNPDLTEATEVSRIFRDDTDGDGFDEWIVFYSFDLQDAQSPIKGAVYDNDRGNPPVIFPYQLRVPNRDYLAEQAGSLEFALEEVTDDRNGPDNMDLPELSVSSPDQLAFFRFNQNSEPWDFPRDAPARYQPIGVFRGNGGVSFDSSTKNVTVFDRNGFERSQLAIRSIHQINPATNTYWDSFDATVLAAPIVSTIDFYREAPRDIVNSVFPEKIVLAFYASACGVVDNTLCRNEINRDPQDFLAGDARQNGNSPGYFGLPSFGVSNLSVSHLRYFPRLESDPDLLPTGGGRDVVTGEQGQLNVVDIEFVVGGLSETARYKMVLVEGQWKITERLQLDTTALDSGIEIPAQ